MRRTYKHKRIISLILSAVLIFGMIPTAFATESAPAETTAETTSPVETTIPVVETTSAAEETTSAAEETTSAAEETTSAAEETTSAAEETTSAAEETTVPETTEDVEETTVPETTVETTVPETTEETEPEEVTKEADASGVTIQVSGNIPEAVELDAAYVREAGFFSFFGSSAPAFNPEIYNVISPMSTVAFAFDITLTNEDGTQWQPENGETVTVTMDVTPFEIADGTKLGIAHDHEGTITKLGEYTVESGKITFETNGFSVFYGFTVDFEYDGTWHSIDGGNGIYLSQLLVELNIGRLISEVSSVEFSDETLLAVTHEYTETGEDWLLKSLVPFSTEEALIITFDDGEVIVINVFDAQTETISNATVNWAGSKSNNYSISGNSTINLTGDVTLGGTITVPANATLTISGNYTITRASTFLGKMIDVAEKGTLIVNGVTFNGGATWSKTLVSGSATRYKATVSGGPAATGAAIGTVGGTIRLSNVVFKNLYTEKTVTAAAAIQVNEKTGVGYASLTMDNVIFKDNITMSGYSIVLLDGSDVDMNNCQFLNNYVGTSYSGTLKASGTRYCVLNMTDCVADGNYSSGWGGFMLWAANVGQSKATLTRCELKNNVARYLGGAISNEATLEVIDCTITGNHAMSGGGIATFPFTLTKEGDAGDNACGLIISTGNRIESNTAHATGTFKPFSILDEAGTNAAGDEWIIANVEKQWTYTGGGGGVWCFMNKEGWDCGLEIGEGNTIQNNNAKYLGGGVLVEHQMGNVTELKITGAEIVSNSAVNGGGVAVTNATVSVERGAINENTATKFGGGVYVEGNAGSAIVTGSGSVSGNEAANGGGVYVAANSDLTISGGVITDNKAQGTPTNPATAYADQADKGVGGGIYVANNGTFVMNKVDESIPVGLYGNEADFAADDAYASGSGTSLTIPDVKGMPLSGTKFSEAEGWFLDYARPDSNYDSTTNKTGFTADNPGRYRTTDGRKINAGTQISNGKNYYCLTLGRTPVLWISKQIQENVKPDQSFRFHVKGNGIDTWVTLNPESFNDAGFAQVKIGTMPTGHFTITEDTNWSWRYGFVSASAEVDQAPATSGTSITINLTDNGEEVTFVNKRDENKWLDWEHSVDNKFSPENVA